MMKNIINLVLFAGVVLYGCSGDDATTGGQQGMPSNASQEEAIEQIWASDLDAGEKARRVQQILYGNGQ